MGIVLEILLLVAIIYGVTRVVLKLLDNHKELKLLREQHAQRLEQAKTAKDVADELLLDKDLACEVQRRLEERLDKECLPPKSER